MKQKSSEKIRITKKHFTIIALTGSLVFPNTARSDIFGGDVVVLSQILVQTIQQLSQLRSILGAGQDSLGLLRDINKGINDSLVLMKTVSPNNSPGLYSDWEKVDQALRGVQGVYGTAVPSSDVRVQKDADQSVAEAVSLNNSIYIYTNEIDQIGEKIKDSSHSTSPGGAQKLTAEALGVMLHVMNESLRAQATGLKLQAQEIAIQNHKDKAFTQHMISSSDSLKAAMKAEPANFNIPRF